MSRGDFDTTDVCSIQPSLVGDGAHDIARLHAVVVADRDSEGLHGHVALGLAASFWPAFSARPLVAITSTLSRLDTFLGQQQGLLAERHARERGRNLGGRDVVLLFESLHNRLQKLQLPFCEYIGNALFKVGDALIVDGLSTRKLEPLDFLPGRSLNAGKHAAFARRHEQDRLAMAAGAPGTPDTMNVSLAVVGNIKVDDVADAINIDAAGRDVCGHQNIQRPALQA